MKKNKYSPYKLNIEMFYRELENMPKGKINIKRSEFDGANYVKMAYLNGIKNARHIKKYAGHKS